MGFSRFWRLKFRSDPEERLFAVHEAQGFWVHASPGNPPESSKLRVQEKYEAHSMMHQRFVV